MENQPNDPTHMGDDLVLRPFDVGAYIEHLHESDRKIDAGWIEEEGTLILEPPEMLFAQYTEMYQEEDAYSWGLLMAVAGPFRLTPPHYVDSAECDFCHLPIRGTEPSGNADQPLARVPFYEVSNENNDPVFCQECLDGHKVPVFRRSQQVPS